MKYNLIKKLRKDEVKLILSIGGAIGDHWVMIPKGMEEIARILRGSRKIWGLWQE